MKTKLMTLAFALVAFIALGTTSDAEARRRGVKRSYKSQRTHARTTYKRRAASHRQHRHAKRYVQTRRHRVTRRPAKKHIVGKLIRRIIRSVRRH